MKKKIILLLNIVFCTACNMSKEIIRVGNGNLVLEYNSYAIFSNTAKPNVYYIRIYDDKTISIGSNDELKLKKEIADEDYQKIVNYAFSSKFINLKEDLSDKSVMDGSYRYIILYNEDGTSKKYGGANPSNRTFLKLYDMLYELISNEES